jgi:hypothetical protein
MQKMERQDQVVTAWDWLEDVHLSQAERALAQELFDLGMNDKQSSI